jgi:hypothetical protein
MPWFQKARLSVGISCPPAPSWPGLTWVVPVMTPSSCRFTAPPNSGAGLSPVPLDSRQFRVATHETLSAPARVSVTPSKRCDTVALARRRIGRKPGDGCSRTRAFAPRPWGISCRIGIRLGSRSLQESDFRERGCERRAFSWKRIWQLSFPRKRESRDRQSLTGCPRSRA